MLFVDKICVTKGVWGEINIVIIVYRNMLIMISGYGVYFWDVIWRWIFLKSEYREILTITRS